MLVLQISPGMRIILKRILTTRAAAVSAATTTELITKKIAKQGKKQLPQALGRILIAFGGHSGSPSYQQQPKQQQQLR